MIQHRELKKRSNQYTTHNKWFELLKKTETFARDMFIKLN